ncbi:MAG: 4Fe-4S dicluster domain-containing protein [Bacteroidota bacterium]
MSKNKSNIDRRSFLKNGAVAVVALGAVGAGANYLKGLNEENAKTLLRPPGAVNEEEFIYACIKCGLCVQICPIEAVKLAGIKDGLSIGTPYIDPRKQACDFSCDAMQCIETCPTAALDFIPFKKAGENALVEYQKANPEPGPGYNPFIVQSKAMKENTNMGVAVLKAETCLAVQGKGYKGVPREDSFTGVYRSPDPERKERKASPVNDHQFDREICDLCVTECPIGDTAIVLEEKSDDTGKKYWQPKILDACTGCGVCVMICPTTPSSIVIDKVEMV